MISPRPGAAHSAHGRSGRHFELATAIKVGRDAQAQLDHGALSVSERRQARHAVGAGQAARTTMIEANMALVYDAVKKLGSRYASMREDLAQEGMIGLTRAVDRFDPDLGYQFSTYATWWIRDSLLRYINDNGHTIRLPREVQRERARLLRRMEDGESLEDACGAEELSWTRGRLVTNVPRAVQWGVELDEELEFDPVDPNSDFTESVHRDDARRAERGELLATMARLLDDGEIAVLTRRYGLDGDEPLTPTEIADRTGVPRVSVSAMEVRALAKLMHPSVYQLLEGIDLAEQ